MTYAWYDILGTLGVAVIIVTYVLLQIGRVKSEQLGVFAAKRRRCVADTCLALLQL